MTTTDLANMVAAHTALRSQVTEVRDPEETRLYLRKGGTSVGNAIFHPDGRIRASNGDVFVIVCQAVEASDRVQLVGSPLVLDDGAVWQRVEMVPFELFDIEGAADKLVEQQDKRVMDALLEATSEPGYVEGPYGGYLDEPVDTFDHDRGCTIRTCIDCGVLVEGGPTRCIECVAKIDPERETVVLDAKDVGTLKVETNATDFGFTVTTTPRVEVDHVVGDAIVEPTEVPKDTAKIKWDKLMDGYWSCGFTYETIAEAYRRADEQGFTHATTPKRPKRHKIPKQYRSE